MNIHKRKEHKDILKVYKKLCRHKQIEFWKKEKEKIDTAHNNFWDIWKNLGEDHKQAQNIKANGKEWENYFTNLYKKENEPIHDILENINIKESNKILNKPLTMKELKQSITKVKKNKASGYDNINSQFLKLSTERIFRIILTFLNLTLTESMITSNWCLDIITPIHKEGTKSNPDNYRGICMMNSLLKHLCTMMNNRLDEYTEQTNLINHGQIGFKRHSRTSDHVLTLKGLINKYDKKNKLYTCFVDFKKAFDSIWHKAMFHKLKRNKINGNFLDLLRDIYKKSRCAIKLNNKLTNFFNHEKGVRQGDPLSPTLFNIFINDLFEELDKSNTDPVTTNNIDHLSALMFADDLILISTTKD